jgi:putative restriction endonuclease
MTRQLPTKAKLMADISELMGIPSSTPTIGSSVPRVFFSDIAAQMGLMQLGSMPAMAKQIIEANNLNWSSEFSSEETPSGGGGTVTALGLMQVKNAVLKWLGREIELIPNVYVISEWEPALDWELRKAQLDRAEIANVLRPGAADFRALVLDEYSSKCSVTGCAVVEVLEVAHIVPYYGVESDDIQNAIVLRSDIHKLFDRGLISFQYTNNNKDLMIHVNNEIYAEYGHFNNTVCSIPKNLDSRPSKAALFIRNFSKSPLFRR